jgi:xanthine dehydrogenase YagR molybdenum-binding subunit
MTRKLVGDPVDRVDGPLKVTGTAPYPSDITIPGMAHAALVQSTIAAGTITRIDMRKAGDAEGVVAVITHQNAPPVPDGPMMEFGPSPPFPLKDNRVLHHGQHLAIVVAETAQQARAAARLVEVEYAPTPAILTIDDPRAPVARNPWGLETQRGDVAAAFATAEVTYEETFTTAPETNNPLGLFATVAEWNGSRLTVHDATQWPTAVRKSLAAIFGIREADVRVLVPFLGGGFGAGLKVWPHVVLTALAARVVARPVKLVLTRPQMFNSIGHRPETIHRVRLGATRDGRLVALDHEAASTVALEDANIEPLLIVTGESYACPNVATHERQVRLNIPNPGAMRAPGATQSNFAIESALDELSYRLAIDPIELRLRNYSEIQQSTGLPWSSKALRDCYRVGAERFGWSARAREIGSMRKGNWLIGYGMAGAAYEFYMPPCQVNVTLRRDGTAWLGCTATDIGTGTYTIATQLGAELLGLEVPQVHVEIGDTDLAPAPQSGGSGLAGTLGAAINDGAGKLIRDLVKLVAEDARSPLRGRRSDEVAVSGGRIHLKDDRSRGEAYVDILVRHELDELSALGENHLKPEGTGMAGSSAFGAQFAEVRVDADLGLIRVTRLVSVIDGGRVLNAKTGRSQILGAAIMGIGMALLDETSFDPSTGRVANATLADYLIPTNADVPELDVMFVGEPDRFNPIGTKGIGEIGLIGVAAAIANAVYHATGKRIRSLPITLDKLL